MKRHIILVGPPGSGKGTQSEFLIKNYPFQYISTSDLIKKNHHNVDMKSGELVNDDTVNRLMLDALMSSIVPCLIDGYPRTLKQCSFLKASFPLSHFIVMYFKVDQSLLIDRMLSRVICQDCGHIQSTTASNCSKCNKCHSSNLSKREDDTYSVIQRRLKVFKELTLPVVDFFDTAGIMHEIDASTSQKDVQAQLIRILSDQGVKDGKN